MLSAQIQGGLGALLVNRVFGFSLNPLACSLALSTAKIVQQLSKKFFEFKPEVDELLGTVAGISVYLAVTALSTKQLIVVNVIALLTYEILQKSARSRNLEIATRNWYGYS